MSNNRRQIVLDTETTGMSKDGAEHYLGHKIIEIGAVEIVNRRLTQNHFHTYINPNRMVDLEALNVHGIKDEFLKDKPDFKTIAPSLMQFIDGAELIIHNAPFDIGFLCYEFKLADVPFVVEERCQIIDTLALAKKQFPGKRNNLDVLCQRFNINNSQRILHGALLDAEILADVYLAMTGGQTALSFEIEELSDLKKASNTSSINIKLDKPINVITATHDELENHKKILKLITKQCGGALWDSTD